MTTGLRFRSQAFPTDPEGSVGCNESPGSHLAEWTKQQLDERGYQCSTILQEDYGWGFWIKEQNLDIWLFVGLCVDEEFKKLSPPEWGIYAKHDAPFSPAQWFKGQQGKAAASKIIADVKAAVLSNPDLTFLEDDDAL